MAARLGNVLFWASLLIAGGWVWLNNYEQQNSAITWGGAVLIWLVGRACQYVLGGDKPDDDKKQLEVKEKPKDTNTISTESVPLKEGDVYKAARGELVEAPAMCNLRHPSSNRNSSRIS